MLVDEVLQIKEIIKLKNNPVSIITANCEDLDIWTMAINKEPLLFVNLPESLQTPSFINHLIKHKPHLIRKLNIKNLNKMINESNFRGFLELTDNKLDFLLLFEKFSNELDFKYLLSFINTIDIYKFFEIKDVKNNIYTYLLSSIKELKSQIAMVKILDVIISNINELIMDKRKYIVENLIEKIQEKYISFPKLEQFSLRPGTFFYKNNENCLIFKEELKKFVKNSPSSLKTFINFFNEVEFFEIVSHNISLLDENYIKKISPYFYYVVYNTIYDHFYNSHFQDANNIKFLIEKNPKFFIFFSNNKNPIFWNAVLENDMLKNQLKIFFNSQNINDIDMEYYVSIYNQVKLKTNEINFSDFFKNNLKLDSFHNYSEIFLKFLTVEDIIEKLDNQDDFLSDYIIEDIVEKYPILLKKIGFENLKRLICYYIDSNKVNKLLNT